MKRSLLLLMTIVLLGGSFGVRAEEIPSYTAKMKATTDYFGTVCSLTLYDDYTRPEAVQRYQQAWDALKTLLSDVENAVSVSVPTSDIARYNALSCGQSTPISPITAQIFQKAREMHRRTGGYYDPTVCPLVDLWGFSPRFTYRDEVRYAYDRERVDGVLPPPDRRWVERLLPLVNMDGVVLQGDADSGYTLCKNTPAVVVDGVAYQAQLDLGGIAKGYVVDMFMATLREMGYEYGHLSCGSSSIGLMKTASLSAREKGDAAYRLQVRRPRDTESDQSAYAMIRVADCALSSSGDYEFNYLADGQLCCHLIDPFTGYPVSVSQQAVQQGICTVTLLSGSAMEDDALTTALCLMGPGGAIAYYNRYLRDHDIAMVLYRADEKVYEVVTNLNAQDLEILDDSYRVACTVDEQGDVVYCGRLFASLFENGNVDGEIAARP